MKKFISFAVAMLTAVSMFAQNEVGSFSIAPKLGINMSTIIGDDDAKMKVGFIGGVEVGYQINAKLALTTGVLYSAQGAKFSEGNFNLNYLNVPILANVYVAKGFALKAGIQPGFLLSAKSLGHDYKDRCNKVDLSIPVGLSYEFSNVILDARYNIGLTKIEKDGDANKNSVIQVTLGYKF